MSPSFKGAFFNVEIINIDAFPPSVLKLLNIVTEE